MPTHFDDLSHDDQRALLATLEELRTTCISAATGFEKAADDVRDDPALRELLRAIAEQRRAHADQLADRIVCFGGKSGLGRSLASELHRAWIDLRAYVDRHDVGALLAECLRGDRAAFGRYQAAMEKKLPSDVATMLLDQAAAIVQTREPLAHVRSTA